MKYILYFMMMIYGSLCHAIVCKHIVEISETNTRKVHQIRRDALGIYDVYEPYRNKPV